MSPNRKADLQRKLAIAPVPKPPAGLAERIKSDIPQHLLVDVRKERERLSKSIAFNLRVAASVILLVGSVYLAMRVLSMKEFERTSMEAPKNVVIQPKAQTPAAAPARVAEAAPPQVAVPTTASVAPPKPKPTPTLEAKKREEIRSLGYVGGSAPSAPLPPAPAPPPATAAESADVYGYAAPRAAAKVSGGFVPEAKAAGITLAPSTLFDIPTTNDLVQRFAAPAAPPRALRVDAEATTLEETSLLRVSVDAPEVEHPAGGSQPPVAGDAKLEVAFDDENVVSHRALAGTMSSTASAIPSASSVTALFAVELKPALGANATIATVTLRYNSVVSGKPREITHKVRLRDWDEASKRMKATSLAAALVDGLVPKETIAMKARAAGLNELAEMAERR